MCRVYRRMGSPSYIRLCSYFGERKGDRIPVEGAEWIASGHVGKVRKVSLFGPLPRVWRCVSCGAPLSRDAPRFQPCDLCVMEKERGIRP